MAEQPGAGHLDPETLAAYIDGLLPPEERAKVEAEIAADPETYEWVVNAVNAVEDPSIAATADVRPVAAASTPEGGKAPSGGTSSTNVVPFTRRRAVLGSIGTLLAAAAALLIVVRTQPVWWQDLWGPAVDPRFAKLVEAVGEERYIEARLTGGFKYGPLREAMRAGDTRSTTNVRLLSAARELERQATADSSAEALHALGVAFVLLGAPGDLDAGIRHLEAAMAKGTDPRVKSDLGAAHLERHRRAGGDDDLRRALALSEESIAVDASSETAWFNRALALQVAGRVDEARRAWTTVLSLQGEGPWADEARRQLARLAQ